jgi:hypothetical protein
MAAAGTIAAAVFNSQRTKESDPVRHPAEFIPKPLHELVRAIDEPEVEEPLTIEELSSFFGAVKK